MVREGSDTDLPPLRSGIDPKGHQNQEGRLVGQLEQLLDQLAGRGVRPVDVLDRDDHRALLGQAATHMR